ncbi:MAG TPA: 50S ribosomal protein L5 [Candidatus Omnitrophota bacterium]|nr:50S ribosomal protein L5 [Candidatus Omnitrophota bacterium]HPT07539.1 50S ribosomal protein L5 [Candidatus Omnitrophota bacterium]
MTPRLLEKYRKEIVPAMQEKFGLKNRLAVPRIDKVVVNMGVGEATQDVKILDKAVEELAAITGQKPVVKRVKKAISNFKIRAGQPVGCMVTLRKNMMYEFMDRFFNAAMPRIRDFRGVPVTSFDQAGNYTLGLTEQGIFPELEFDRITRAQGMDITFVIKNSKSREMSKELLKQFGMPFVVESNEREKA